MNDLLALFTQDDLFGKSSDGRSPHEKVAIQFRPSYSISPAEAAIRAEESLHLRKLGGVLKDFLMEELPLTQYGFLSKLLGQNWGRRLRLPLEFRDLSEEEFIEFMRESIPSIKERISILEEHCDDPSLEGRAVSLQEFISVPYNMTTADRIIEIYEQVKAGSLDRYPQGYFHPRNARVPRILTRHLVDVVMGMQHVDSLPDKLKPRDFSDNRLGGMLTGYFSGNVERALRHAYTIQEFPSLYKRGYKSEDVLRQVLHELDKKLEDGKKSS